jgi:hypothetical protein
VLPLAFRKSVIFDIHVEESNQLALMCRGPLRSQLVSGPLLSQSLNLLNPFTTLADSSEPWPAICPPITIRAATIAAIAPRTVIAVAAARGNPHLPFLRASATGSMSAVNKMATATGIRTSDR